MVVLAGFELGVIGADGRRLPEVTAGGKTYVVAAPGESFEVSVTRLTSAAHLPYGIFYNASLRVDGQTVGYSKNLERAPVTANFEGWLKAGDTQGCAYQSFMFAKPRETEAKQATGLNFVEGTIRLEVRQAQYTSETSNMRYHGPAAANNSIAKLPEGKKFFMAPSLTTAKGDLKVGTGFSSRSCNFLGGPIATLELRYETAATLLLRGVLKRDNPQHRAILQQFPDTAAPKEDPDEAAGDSENATGPSNAARAGAAAGRAAAAAAAGGRKRRQREQQEELIDLTKAPAMNDEVLAAKAANKTLECDLTADDEPHWRAVKKPVHRV